MGKSYHVISNPVARIVDGGLQAEGEAFEIYSKFETVEEAIAAARREASSQLCNGKRGFSWMRDHDHDAVVVYEYGIAYDELDVEEWDDDDDEADPVTVEVVSPVDLSDMLSRLVAETRRDESYWDRICWDSEVADEGEGTEYQLVNWRGMWGDLQCLRLKAISSEVLLPDFSNGERYATVAEALKLGTWSHVWEDDAPDAALMYGMVEELAAC